MKKSLAELAALVGGEVVGDASFEVDGISSVELAGPSEITFLSNPRYEEQLRASQAGAVIVPRPELGGDKPKLVVQNPYLAYAHVATQFYPLLPPRRGIAPEAFVHDEASVGRDVSIYPLVWVDRGVSLGDRVTLYPGVFVGEECDIGEYTTLYPGVVLYPKCRLGKRVIVHAGSVIGSDGFGYARDGARSIKIPQLGTVRIDDDVEIGANNTIDRASFGVTWIQRGVKTDNLVQIGHNVVIGEDSILTGQVGIAGSSKLGHGVILGGQAGVADHIQIGDGAMVGPQAGVGQDVPPGAIVSGTPSIAHRVWLRTTPIVPRLPELLKRLRKVEKKLAELEKEIHDSEGA